MVFQVCSRRRVPRRLHVLSPSGHGCQSSYSISPGVSIFFLGPNGAAQYADGISKA